MADRKSRRARPQRNGLVEIVNALLTLLVLSMLVVGGLFLYGAHSFYAAGPIPNDTTFVVEKGSNLGLVAERLESQGLIDNRYVFQLGGWALKEQSGIKAGEFKIVAGSSMADVLREITSGKPINHGITIPEGFTIAQVLDRLKQDDRLTGDITSAPPEGAVLPQTYNYDPGSTRQAVLDQMVAAQKLTLADIWAQRDPDLPITTPDQLVTLASIVEKETGIATERGHVASVFVNRLKKHMRLQSDPTVIYGITKGVAPLGRDLKRSEIEAVTPYNTYQMDGLPPGPIANPGLEALKATANPDKTNDIYFVAVSANPSDGHLFSSNYADHRKNVAKFRTAQQQQANASASADAEAAKEALQESQATAVGDNVSPPPADQTASDQTPTATAPATTDQPATDPAAAAAPNGDVPVPMPADARPTTSDKPAAPSATGAPVTPAKPKPVVRPLPADSFGG